MLKYTCFFIVTFFFFLPLVRPDSPKITKKSFAFKDIDYQYDILQWLVEELNLSHEKEVPDPRLLEHPESIQEILAPEIEAFGIRIQDAELHSPNSSRPLRSKENEFLECLLPNRPKNSNHQIGEEFCLTFADLPEN